MSQRILRISSVADLLALVPCVLGFHPEESLVLVVLAGDGGNLHARVDLTPDQCELRAGVASLVTAVHRTGGRTVALVAYTDDPALADHGVGLMVDELTEHGVEVLSAIRADGTHWYPVGRDDDRDPSPGTPYDLSAHPITAQSVLDGHVTFGSRRELADSLVGTDLDDMEAVAEAADEAMRRFQEAARHPRGDAVAARRHLVAEGHWVRDRVQRFLATGEPLDAGEAGRLAVAMVSIEVRDVAWSEMTRSTARSHVELWRDLVRRTPLDLRAAPAALLGFAAWLSGDGALAWCAVERCQEAEPDYRLAGLLSQALVDAISPATWSPVPVHELPLFAG